MLQELIENIGDRVSCEQIAKRLYKTRPSDVKDIIRGIREKFPSVRNWIYGINSSFKGTGGFFMPLSCPIEEITGLEDEYIEVQDLKIFVNHKAVYRGKKFLEIAKACREFFILLASNPDKVWYKDELKQILNIDDDGLRVRTSRTMAYLAEQDFKYLVKFKQPDDKNIFNYKINRVKWQKSCIFS